MKTILIAISVGLILISKIAISSPIKQDTLFQTKDVILALSNPGLLHAQHLVLGDFYLYDNHLSYKAYTEDSLIDDKTKKLYSYNSLIRDLDIRYDEIEKIKKGFLFSIRYTQLIVILENGKKFKFTMSTIDKRKVILLVNAKMKSS